MPLMWAICRGHIRYCVGARQGSYRLQVEGARINNIARVLEYLTEKKKKVDSLKVIAAFNVTT